VGILLESAWLAIGVALLCFEYVEEWRKGENAMSSIFYIIGVVVVVLIVLSFLGLR
jgi:hypothetical protein